MSFKFYSSPIVTSITMDVDKGNLADWTYVTQNGKKILKTYKKTDWDNIIYVPKAGGTTIVNSYNVSSYGAGYTPFYNNRNVKRVDLQKVPFLNNSMWTVFGNCFNLTAVYNISASVQNMTSTFSDCYNFNQNLVLPTNLEQMLSTFYGCSKLNQNIKIPSKVVSVNSAFRGCSSLNQNIKFPSSVRSMTSTFENCYKLNQNIQISSTAWNIGFLFENCRNLNQSIKIPASVQQANCVFEGCSNFNPPLIQFPNKVFALREAFRNCTNFSGRVDIFCTEIDGASYYINNCFANTSKAKQVYIYYKYANGTYTKTYNSCFSTYGINNRCGVTMHDLGTCPW